MSWLSRLFGAKPAPPAPPPPTAVTVPDDLAAALTAGGATLQEAVETALRDQLEVRRRQAEAAGVRAERVPFWLARGGDVEEGAGHGDLEERLRERVEQRRAADEAGD